jgi:hypothetical protein
MRLFVARGARGIHAGDASTRQWRQAQRNPSLRNLDVRRRAAPGARSSPSAARMQAGRSSSRRSRAATKRFSCCVATVIGTTVACVPPRTAAPFVMASRFGCRAPARAEREPPHRHSVCNERPLGYAALPWAGRPSNESSSFDGPVIANESRPECDPGGRSQEADVRR